MKKNGLILLALAVLGMAGCSVQMDNERGGNTLEKTFDYKNFTSLDVSSAFKVDVAEGDFSVVINGDEKILRDVEVKEQGGVLVIALRPGLHFNFFAFNHQLNAHIRMPKLENINGEGATQFVIASPMTFGKKVSVDLSGASVMTGDIIADAVTMRLEGAATYKGMIKTGSLDAEMSGASYMTTTGSAQKSIVEASGASGFKGSDFDTVAIDARAEGASTIKLKATGEARLEASGASNITLEGKASILSQESSGVSNIRVN